MQRGLRCPSCLTPKLTLLVGELVAARLIAKAGSFMTLAKSPGSTVQILGAEKALFRALKPKKSTPKYGLNYHGSLVGTAQNKAKVKVACVLASKIALCARVDALREENGEQNTEEPEEFIGLQCREMVEARVYSLNENSTTSTPVEKPVAAYKRPVEQSWSKEKASRSAEGSDSSPPTKKRKSEQSE